MPEILKRFPVARGLSTDRRIGRGGGSELNGGGFDAVLFRRNMTRGFRRNAGADL